MKTNIIISTTEAIVGREIIQVLGLVKGNTVQTRHIGSHIVAGLTTIVGGEVTGYVKAITTAREEAIRRMLDEAQNLGADAIVSMRFSTSQIMSGAAEILAYGTAVKLR
jgi:uncharacterized protein YbjQ (UPF0145 family)